MGESAIVSVDCHSPADGEGAEPEDPFKRRRGRHSKNNIIKAISYFHFLALCLMHRTENKGQL